LNQLEDYQNTPEWKWDGKKMTNLDDFLRHFWGKHNASQKLQSHILASIRGERARVVAAKATLEQRTRLACRANKSSALVWKAFPLVKEMRLNDDQTRFLLAYATGATLPGLPKKCACRQDLTLEHAVHCGTEKLARHNLLQSRFVAFAREHGVVAQQNQRCTVEQAKGCQEPDIIFFQNAHKPVETDVTVVNPCAPSKLKRKQPAINEAAEAKRRKYEQKADDRQHRFVPLAFETHGAMSPEVITLVNQFAANTPTGVGYAASTMQIDLALTLVRGNAYCAFRAIGRAGRKERLARDGY